MTDSLESTITVRLEDCSLPFSSQDIWASPAMFSGTLYFAISNVDRYYASVRDKTVSAWPLQEMPYGSREFGLRDCNGYCLAFTQISVGSKTAD